MNPLVRPIVSLLFASLVAACAENADSEPPPQVPPPPPPSAEPAPLPEPYSQATTPEDRGPPPATPAPTASQPAPPPPPPPPPAGASAAEQPPPPTAAPLVNAYPTGQWVYLSSYGWVWVPAGAASTEMEGVPYAYLYTPAYGWTWYVSPWGWGPYRYGFWVRHPWHPVGLHGYWVARPRVVVHLGRGRR
jgi:hypothetical protein